MIFWLEKTKKPIKIKMRLNILVFIGFPQVGLGGEASALVGNNKKVLYRFVGCIIALVFVNVKREF